MDRLYDEIEALGAPRPAIAVLDLATATAVDTTHSPKIIGSEFGRLDGLVHTAGLLGIGPRSNSTTCPPGARCCT